MISPEELISVLWDLGWLAYIGGASIGYGNSLEAASVFLFGPVTVSVDCHLMD